MERPSPLLSKHDSMALKMIRYYAYLLIILYWNEGVEAVIGINWGRQSAQRLIPSQVVDLLLQNGVPEVRLYTANSDVLRAFAGSGISLTISRFETRDMTSINVAREWVQKRLVDFPNSNVSTIYYGNAMGWARANYTYDMPQLNNVLSTMMLLHNALFDFGYGDKIKLTIPQPSEILKENVTKPSEAEFRDDLKQDIATLLRYLKDNDAPFVIELMPITFITDNNFDLSFAFCDNASPHVITDANGLVYMNVFEFVHDSFLWAMRKLGVPDLKIIVGPIGWPTDGCLDANIQNAERFYKSFLPFISSNKGTPLRPGAPIDVFLHSLTDENKMIYNNPYSRHCGIYRGNGEPKFKIDLSGQGRDIYPTRAAGIMRMPSRWCVYNGVNKSKEELMEQFEFACERSDCTSLVTGGSCSHLDFAGNISYAFNNFFQFNFQVELACDFNGLGEVVTTDPSNGSCVFSVDVVRGAQDLLGFRVLQSGAKVREVPIFANAILLVLVSTFLALL